MEQKLFERENILHFSPVDGTISFQLRDIREQLLDVMFAGKQSESSVEEEESLLQRKIEEACQNLISHQGKPMFDVLVINTAAEHLIHRLAKKDVSLKTALCRAMIVKFGSSNHPQLRSFMHRLTRTQDLIRYQAPAAMLEKQICENLLPLEECLEPEWVPKIYPMHFEKMKKNRAYCPLLGRSIHYGSWANRIVANRKGISLISDQLFSTAGFVFQDDHEIDVIENVERSCMAQLYKFSTFFSVTDLPGQQQLSEHIFAYLNGHSPPLAEEDSIARYMSEHFEEHVAQLPRRVGVLKNQRLLSKIHHLRAASFIKAAISYRRSEGYKIDKESATFVLGEAKKLFTDFYTLNPTPELLKSVFAYFHRQLSPGAPERKRKRKGSKLEAGQRVPLLSDKELNGLNWLVKNQPKSDQGRDDRRRLHAFVLHLVERRIQREDDPVVVFMSEAITRLKREYVPVGQTVGPAEKELQQSSATSFTRFAVVYASLPKYFQKNTCKAIHAKMEELTKANVEGKLTEKEYAELTRFILEQLVRNLFKDIQTLTPDQITTIQTHIQKYPDLWQKDNLLIAMARYHGFCWPEGKRAVELFLYQLASAGNDGQLFIELPRYAWEQPGIRRWFGDNLIAHIQSGYTRNVRTKDSATNYTIAFQEIWQDVLIHLGLPQVELSTLFDSTQIRFQRAKKDTAFTSFWSTLQDIHSKLVSAQEISHAQVRAWQKELRRHDLREIFPAWQEFLLGLEQIIAVQRGARPSAEFEFRITEDPLEILRSAEKPYYTCQRITEPTGFNQAGQPIHRARQGQFFLAQARTGSVVDSRTVLEIAFEKVSKKKILLVERMYTLGGVHREDFQKQILEWALATNEIAYVVFSGSHVQKENGMTTSIEMNVLPSDGEVYRDTQWGNRVTAVDIKKYANQPQAHPQPMDRLRTGVRSS